VFKNIFGVEKHKRVLICLLNSILKGRPHINDLTFTDKEHKKNKITGRSVTLDIEAVTDNNTLVNIEIQCCKDGNIANRAYFYQSKMMKEEIEEGETFDSIPDIISIWITDYNETKRLYHTSETVPMFKKTPLDEIDVASEKTRIFIIELPKVDLKQANIKDMFLIWMYFLKNPELIPEEFVTKVSEVKEAVDELKYLSGDKEFRLECRARVKRKNSITSRMTRAEQEGMEKGVKLGRKRGKAEGKKEGMELGKERGIKKGKRDGMKEGMELGKEKGRKEGEKKGKTEGAHEKAVETAMKLLSRNMSPKDIADITGLSIKEIKRLSDNTPE
jgi:predicted transposase/invertase (TIGR01784 family)